MTGSQKPLSHSMPQNLAYVVLHNSLTPKKLNDN